MKQEQYQDAIQMYEDGIPPTQIARDLEMGRATVNRWIRQHKVSLEYAEPYLNDEDDEGLSGIRKFDLELREEDIAIRKMELASKIVTWKDELLKDYKGLCKDLLDKIESDDLFTRADIRTFKHQTSDLIAKFDLIYNHDSSAFDGEEIGDLKPRLFLESILRSELEIIPQDGLMLPNQPLFELLEEGLALSYFDSVDISFEWDYQESVVDQIHSEAHNILVELNNEALDHQQIKKLSDYFHQGFQRVEALNRVFNIWPEENEQEMVDDIYSGVKEYLKTAIYYVDTHLLKSFSLFNTITGKMARVPEQLLESPASEPKEEEVYHGN
ncbi:MAG: transposase-like protein [Nonlabens sp.]|jgi:transposase-like protein